ncbi:MAG: EcoKI restriction-modification system protein HsdS [Pelotomaculum sp. PtaB.Bin104]|nr:MAG: EcoKI restriction-modification system protein HsdS [Pelotomaculum sp. PtaB.Bin104]
MNPEIQKRIEQIQKGYIPEGYKKTKIGIVSGEWDKYKFVNLFSAVSEFTVDTETYPLHSLTIENGVIPKSERYERGFLVQKTENTYKIVRENQFVYNPMNLRFGAIARYKGTHPISVSGYYDVFSCKDRKHIIFMDYFLKSDKLINFYNRMATGSLVEKQRVHFSQFLDFELRLPSTNECEKIAEILSTWNKAIELKDGLIFAKKQQKKWLMHNLLIGKWHEVQMGDVFEFEGGFSASRNELNSDEGICYLHYGDIHKSNKLYIDVRAEYSCLPKLIISVNKLNSKCLLCDGDVVFADASEDYEGICKYVVVKNKENIPFIAGLHTIIARPKNDSISDDFKLHCFGTSNVKKQFAIHANGISVYGISKNSIAKILIPCPPLPEQTAIANILSTADHEIDLHEKQLEELKKQKKALMQLLLTGIVRVNAEKVI